MIRCVAEAIGIIMLITYLFYDSLIISVIFLPYVYIHCKVRIRTYRNSIKEKTGVSFKDGIQVLKSLLQTGYSFENAIRGSLAELESIYGEQDPTYVGFCRISNKLSLNIPIEEAFEAFAAECEVEEVQYFSEVLKYAKRSGGNLIAIISETAEILSDRIDVKREITTIMAAGRLEQSIMNIVPLAIILYMRISSFGMMDKLYGNMSGVIIMTISLLIYVFAIFIASKISNVQV